MTPDAATAAGAAAGLHSLQAALADLATLHQMLDTGRLATDGRRVALVRDLYLVFLNGEPASVAPDLLPGLSQVGVGPAPARFGLRAASPGVPIGGDALSQLEYANGYAMAQIRARAAEAHARPLLAGLLPTLRGADLHRDVVTPIEPFPELSRKMAAARRGDSIVLDPESDAPTPMDLAADSALLELSAADCALHLDVPPDALAHTFNVAQALTAPLVSATANAPFSMGRRVWPDSRVALFRECLDDRSRAAGTITRSRFGEGWATEPMALAREDLTRLPFVLHREWTDDRALDGDTPPSLDALRTFWATVRRWNGLGYEVRADPAGGPSVPTLSLVSRILPAGPTIVDEIANVALLTGLLLAADRFESLHERMDFDDARINLLAAGRHALDAELTWLDGEVVEARTLLRDTLLPLAWEGLGRAHFDPADLDRFLGVVEERLETDRTAATWLIESLSEHGEAPTRAEVRSVTNDLADRQQREVPIHVWRRSTEPLELEEAMGALVEDVVADAVPPEDAPGEEDETTEAAPVSGAGSDAVRSAADAEPAAGSQPPRRAEAAADDEPAPAPPIAPVAVPAPAPSVSSLLQHDVMRLHVDDEVAVARPLVVAVEDDDGRLMGVLERADLAALSEPGQAGRTLGEVMRAAPTPITPDAPVTEAISALAHSGRAWVPVVDDGRLLGVVTRDDLIEAAARILDGGRSE